MGFLIPSTSNRNIELEWDYLLKTPTCPIGPLKGERMLLVEWWGDSRERDLGNTKGLR